MKAAVLHAANDIRIEEYPDPAPGPGEIVVRTKAAGICSKNIKTMLGGELTAKLPFIPGHELAGEIETVGLGVRGFSPGDPVAVYSGGLLGCSVNGAYAEQMLVPKEIVEAGGTVRLDEEISFEDAVMAEPLACTFAAARINRMKEGQTVLIVGCGSVGLMHLKTARWSGCKVIAADKNAARLALAGQMGAGHLINTSQSSLSGEMTQLTGGRGADVVIISVLMPELVADCLKLTAQGGVCSLSSSSPESEAGVDQAVLAERGIALTGSCAATPGDFRKCLQLIKEEAIIVSDMISHRFTLDDFQEAVAKSKNQELIRGVITCSGMLSLSF
jgi:threonine dehydrogenase-like Zn-dependent dehydrogenase